MWRGVIILHTSLYDWCAVIRGDQERKQTHRLHMRVRKIT